MKLSQNQERQRPDQSIADWQFVLAKLDPARSLSLNEEVRARVADLSLLLEVPNG